MRWFQGFQTRRSGETAKMRLKLLLVSDKAGCSPEMILMIKDDVIHAISKYMEIEKDKVRYRWIQRAVPKKAAAGHCLCFMPTYRFVPYRTRGYIKYVFGL